MRALAKGGPAIVSTAPAAPRSGPNNVLLAEANSPVGLRALLRILVSAVAYFFFANSLSSLRASSIAGLGPKSSSSKQLA